MAEAIAVVAVVSSIVQLVDFTSKVIARLNDIQSGTKDIPKSLKYLSAELPVLLHTLQQIHDALKADRFPPKCATALQPAVDGCKESIQEMESSLFKTLPKQGDGKTRSFIKAVGSVWNEGKIERITATIRGCIATLTFYFAASSSIQQPVMDEEISSIQKWLSAPDPSENFFKALRLREPRTGLWLLEGDLYRDWKIRPSLVWLYGIPGCGKTILSTTVLEDIRKYTADDPGKATIYFYFDFNDRRKQNVEMMVRSLLLQLLQQYFEILPTVEALFESSRRGHPLPSLEIVLEVLKELLVKFPCTYLVLDALDECEDHGELMKIINTLISWKVDGLHVLCTSRREGDITTTLERIIDAGNILNIQTKAVDRDIQLYVHRRITDEPALQKWKDKDKQLMEQSLTEGSHGMFRLAACRLDILKKCRNRKQLLRAIAELPPDLDEMYNRILGQIAKDDVPYAIRILRWLTFASRPLYLKEVAEVAALDPDCCPAFDRDEVLQDPAEVLAICSSLVTVVQEPSMEYFDEQNDCYIGQYSHNSVDLVGKSERVVVLAHYSVKEYLVSQRILESEAKLYGIDPDIGHKTLAKSCLLYLFQLDVSDLPKHVVRRDFVLTIYSAEEWIRHYRLIQTPDPELNELVVELFKAENTFSTMIMFSPKRRAQFWPYRKKLTKSVFVACELGLPDIVQRLVSETDFDVNEAHNETTTLLEIAARSGFSSLVKFLLEKGAIANEGALNSACSNGHLELVRLLLEQGAQVNTHGAKGFSALRCASLSGHLGTVQYLIERGADVKVPDELALCQASQYGHLDIVRVLVENGADINASVVADYNTLGGLYGNALCGASYRGHFEVVEYLVENGANVNVSDGRDRKPLHGASCNNHLEIVKYLVKKGADVDGSESHQNALVAASEEGNFEVVQCLVENGANVNASVSDGWHGNALYSASYKNHLEIVEYLVKNGADVDATSSGKYKNALIAASARGNFEVVRCLVENGADVNAQGNDGQRSALEEAASRCLWDHWDYCFENGIGVNFQGGGTSMDQDDIVKYLIEHGAVNKTSVDE